MHLIDLPDQSFVFDLIPPMELHLMLRVINNLFKPLRDIRPKADNWSRLLHIQSQPHHGGQFADNECHKFLKNFNLLQKLAENDCAFQAVSIIDALQKFGAVVTA